MRAGVISAEIKITYLEQLHHPVEMAIGARVSRLGKSSLFFDSAIFIKDIIHPVNISRTTLVWFDFENNQSEPIPQDVRQMLVDYETIGPLQNAKL